MSDDPSAGWPLAVLERMLAVEFTGAGELRSQLPAVTLGQQETRDAIWSKPPRFKAAVMTIDHNREQQPAPGGERVIAVTHRWLLDVDRSRATPASSLHLPVRARWGTEDGVTGTIMLLISNDGYLSTLQMESDSLRTSIATLPEPNSLDVRACSPSERWELRPDDRPDRRSPPA